MFKRYTSTEDFDRELGNCSVYSLAGGSIRFQDYYNGSWLQNYTSGFLPAYFTTNCSMESLQVVLSEYFERPKSWEAWANGVSPPFSQRDNGDAFVALLFTLSGVTVSLWMLTLLLYLLPRHKRKPLLTQLTTVFTSVVSTVLLTQVTELARHEYYSDMLDIFVFRRVIFETYAYRVCNVISTLLVHLSHLQIVMFITRLWFKYVMTLVGGVLVLVYTVIHGVFEIGYDDADSVVDGPNYSELPSAFAWRVSLVCIHSVLQAWLMVAVFQYTFLEKNPLKTSYAAPTVGLGVSTWALMLVIFVLTVLSVTTFRSQWWVRLWLDQLSTLLDVALLTIAWEWIYNICLLEKKHEITDVLGRRMSSDNVASILGTQSRKWWTLPRPVWSNTPKWLSSSHSDSRSPIEIHETASIQSSHHRLGHVPDHVPEEILQVAGDDRASGEGSTVSYELSPVSSVPSQQQEPPAFMPHPGFSAGDYWNEKS